MNGHEFGPLANLGIILESDKLSPENDRPLFNPVGILGNKLLP